MLTKKDVLNVAHRLSMLPTEAEIKQIIEEHEDHADDDPTGTWNLVVEQQLYELGVEQITDILVTTRIKIRGRSDISTSSIIENLDYNFISQTEGAKIINTEIREYKKQRDK